LEFNRKNHWEHIYQTKNPDQVSWTQEIPSTSLKLIIEMGLDTSASIIDIGGGDSNLVDHLIINGFENVTVLDISEKALEKAKIRLGKNADKVTWIVEDINEFKPAQHYDIWHDRAAFHFLTNRSEIENYVQTASEFTNKQLIIGTFSENGPLKCSGIPIKQYSDQTLSNLFSDKFSLESFQYLDHKTPFNTIQNFVFCNFKKKKE
jgi:SAM-dependent methyltransferase